MKRFVFVSCEEVYDDIREKDEVNQRVHIIEPSVFRVRSVKSYIKGCGKAGKQKVNGDHEVPKVVLEGVTWIYDIAFTIELDRMAIDVENGKIVPEIGFLF